MAVVMNSADGTRSVPSHMLGSAPPAASRVVQFDPVDRIDLWLQVDGVRFGVHKGVLSQSSSVMSTLCDASVDGEIVDISGKSVVCMTEILAHCTLFACLLDRQGASHRQIGGKVPDCAVPRLPIR